MPPGRDNGRHGQPVRRHTSADGAVTELLATFLKLFAERRARFTANQANTACQARPAFTACGPRPAANHVIKLKRQSMRKWEVCYELRPLLLAQPFVCRVLSNLGFDIGFFKQKHSWHKIQTDSSISAENGHGLWMKFQNHAPTRPSRHRHEFQPKYSDSIMYFRCKMLWLWSVSINHSSPI